MDSKTQQVIDQHAEACDSLFRELRSRLGDRWWEGKGGVEFELTPKGRSCIRVGGVVYFRNEETGQPIAGRARGGRAEFALVEPSGRMVWTMAPVGDPSAN